MNVHCVEWNIGLPSFKKNTRVQHVLIAANSNEMLVVFLNYRQRDPPNRRRKIEFLFVPKKIVESWKFDLHELWSHHRLCDTFCLVRFGALKLEKYLRNKKPQKFGPICSCSTLSWERHTLFCERFSWRCNTSLDKSFQLRRTYNSSYVMLWIYYNVLTFPLFVYKNSLAIL